MNLSPDEIYRTLKDCMTIRLDVWGDPIPQEPTPPPKRKYKKPAPPQYERKSTDIEAWLRDNRPKTMSDFDNLRTAIYGRRSCGSYEVVITGTSYIGDQRFELTGPNSVVLIASDKARHFFLGRLRKIRGFMID
jgi:hypothetical protein